MGSRSAPTPAKRLFQGHAGTALRPLTAALAQIGGALELSGVPPQHQRPIGDRVDALLREAIGWAARGEGERVAELIDDDFEGGADEPRLEIRRRLRPGAFEKLELVSLKVGASGDQANATLELRVQYRDIPVPIPETFYVGLRKRGEVWRVISVKRPEGPRR